MSSLPKTISSGEVARSMGVGSDKVRAWIASGRLKAINVSAGDIRPRWRILVRDFEAFLAGQSDQSTSGNVRRRRGKARRVAASLQVGERY